jgi:tetratricopeptide (TPR) repeat protein
VGVRFVFRIDFWGMRLEMLCRSIPQQARLLLLFCSFLGLGLPSSTPCFAQANRDFVTNPFLNKGLTLYNDQRYPEATQEFLKVSTNARYVVRERNQALKYLAFIQLLQRKPDEARNHFIEALKNDPNFELDSVLDPPKFFAFFQVVRKDFLSRRQVVIEDRSPNELPTAQALSLRFAVRDEFQSAKRFAVFYRVEGSGPYQQGSPAPLTAQRLQKERTLQLAQQVLQRSESFSSFACAALCQTSPVVMKAYGFDVPTLTPPDPTAAYFVEYYIEAYDTQGRTISTLGSASDPKRVKRTLPTTGNTNYPNTKATPFYQTWWFWTVVGVVVVGGVVAGVVVGTAPKPLPPATTGTVIVTIVR